MSLLAIKKVEKRFGSLRVLSDISLELQRGCVMTIIGPSGCGKTTLLNVIAGLETPDSGQIQFSEEKPRIGYAMQESLLLPWRTLAENGLLGTEVMNGKKVRPGHSLLETYFKSFELIDQMESYPSTASGGMKQRVALIRTLLLQPDILLLDEAFSNLDFDIKLKIQQIILDYHRETQGIVILVTHDIEDAIALSDEVIVLSDKPTIVKKHIPIDLGITRRDPVKARTSSRFTDYFAQIWEELKYLDQRA